MSAKKPASAQKLKKGPAVPKAQVADGSRPPSSGQGFAARLWLYGVVTLLVLAIIVLVFIGFFVLPASPSGTYKIEIGPIKGSGTYLVIGLAIVLIFVLYKIWPVFQTMLEQSLGMVTNLVSNMVSGMARFF
jgi:hypothetical protein